MRSDDNSLSTEKQPLWASLADVIPFATAGHVFLYLALKPRCATCAWKSRSGTYTPPTLPWTCPARCITDKRKQLRGSKALNAERNARDEHLARPWPVSDRITRPQMLHDRPPHHSGTVRASKLIREVETLLTHVLEHDRIQPDGSRLVGSPTAVSRLEARDLPESVA